MREFAKQLGVDIYAEKTVGIGPDRSDSEFQNLIKELLPKDLSLSRYHLRHDGIFEPKGKISNMCHFVYQIMVINSNGTVPLCCYDESSKYIMGNVFEERIKTIWKNDKYQEIRKRLRQDRKSIPLCSKCSESRHIAKDKILKCYI